MSRNCCYILYRLASTEVSLLGHFQLQFEYKCSNTLYFKIELIEKADSMFYLCGHFF